MGNTLLVGMCSNIIIPGFLDARLGPRTVVPRTKNGLTYFTGFQIGVLQVFPKLTFPTPNEQPMLRLNVSLPETMEAPRRDLPRLGSEPRTLLVSASRVQGEKMGCHNRPQHVDANCKPD